MPSNRDGCRKKVVAQGCLEGEMGIVVGFNYFPVQFCCSYYMPKPNERRRNGKFGNMTID